jgi:glycine cleavage system H protein
VTPEELRYSQTHEWVHVETDASGAEIATVGISAFAIKALTDLVYVDLPPLGRAVTAGEPFGEIESVKAVSDLCSPVTGEVVAVNSELAEHLDKLADDPYGKWWFVKIRITDRAGLADLMDYAAYERQCAEEMQE